MPQKTDPKKPLILSLIAAAGIAIALLPASASLDQGKFLIHAYNRDEPKFEAKAGMKGSLAENPGGENPSDRVLATYSCGNEDFEYLQSMKDLTETNLVLHEQGRDAEMKKGPGGWEAVNVIQASAAELGVEATVVLVGDIELAEHSTLSDVANAGDFTTIYSAVAVPRGNKSHTLQIYGSPRANNNQGVSLGMFSKDAGCNYSKQVEGKLSSLDGSPAAFSLGKDVNFYNRTTWTAFFAKDGIFFREGDRPEFEGTFESDAVNDPVYPMPAYSIVGEFNYPKDTEVANATEYDMNFTFTEKPYSEAYPTR